MKWGKSRTYPLADMAVGDKAEMPAPTAADIKRICRNTSQYGIRHDRVYVSRLDKARRVIVVTRIR